MLKYDLQEQVIHLFEYVLKQLIFLNIQFLR